MRIASLVPSATELLFALGLGDRVVAVTHECDYPPPARELPHLTRSVVPAGLSSAEIDAAVRARVAEGRALYALDEELLARLRVELIATQAVCEVCAVSYDDVVAAADRLPSRPAVLSLDPSTLADVLADVARVADAAGVPAAGEALLADARSRLERVRAAVAGARRPRVLALEWLDPPYVAGHWVPEMIDLAGGVDAVALPGARSRVAELEELRAAQPDVVVSMPCGYDTAGAEAETRAHLELVRSLGAARAFAVDASAYFSRPGPRLVDGVELLAHLLHPDRLPAPPGDRVRAL